MRSEYWQEAVEHAFDDIDILLTPEQLCVVAESMDVAHEMFGMASGEHVATSNRWADQDREIKTLRQQLRDEEAKTVCPACRGHGTCTYNGPIGSASSRCYKCGGAGRL